MKTFQEFLNEEYRMTLNDDKWLKLKPFLSKEKIKHSSAKQTGYYSITIPDKLDFMAVTDFLNTDPIFKV